MRRRSLRGRTFRIVNGDQPNEDAKSRPSAIARRNRQSIGDADNLNEIHRKIAPNAALVWL